MDDTKGVGVIQGTEGAMSNFKVGDSVRIYAEGPYRSHEVYTQIIRVMDEGVMVKGSDAIYHPKQIEFLYRPQKTEKKKVWVHAYETKPLDTTHDTYIKNQSYWVQIDAEVPCE